MAQRSGLETDRAAIAELFRDDKPKAQQIVDDYLEPRRKRNAREKLADRRDHFWTVPPAKPGDRVIADPHVILVEQKLRALKDESFVGKAVAAVYCGISETTLDRRIKDAIGTTDAVAPNEKQLPRKRDANRVIIPGNLHERRYRMTAVRRMKEFVGGKKSSDEKIADRASAKNGSTEEASLTAVVSESGLTITLPRALFDRVLWVKDKHGNLVCHLTINSFASEHIASFLSGGGNVERMTLRDALMRPWISVEEREPWASGYALLLARESTALVVANAITGHTDVKSHAPDATIKSKDTRF